ATEAFAQTLLCGKRSVDCFAADTFDADAFYEIVRTFEKVGIFAVVLEKQSGGLEGCFAGFDSDQEIGFADFLASGAANDDLPTAVLADQADVLDGGFGAIARAADYAHLQFVRSEEIFEAPLELNAGGDGVLHAEPAEVGADAGFHHAHALGVSLAGRH